MKTIGLVGGITWYSSLDYYRYFNEGVHAQKGGDHAAKIVLVSVNYGEIKSLTFAGRWDLITEIISEAAQQAEKAGADCVLLGANTMHHIADAVAASVKIPLIHIADAAALDIKARQISTVGLLGTKYTMELPFYTERLARHGIKTIVPDMGDRQYIHDTIYSELGKGIFLDETRAGYQSVISKLKEAGAGGVILGCTEIPLLIKEKDSPVPVFDTTYLHAKAAVDFALS